VRPSWLLATGAAAAFLVVTVLMATGTTDPLDVAVRDALRPDDVWGTAQVRVDTVVEGLEPARTLTAYGAFVGVLAWWRQSWLVVVHALALLAVAGVPALLVKRAMERTDPHHVLSSMGSFPSGHVLVLLVCVGGAVLALRGTAAPLAWTVVALTDLAMALSLLVQAAHWFTDVVAGALLGVAALAATAPLAPGPGRRSPAPPAPSRGRRATPRSAPPPPS
jgi:membrane-associated phospholipid phosphatase